MYKGDIMSINRNLEPLKKITQGYLDDLSRQLESLLLTVYSDPDLQQRVAIDPKTKYRARLFIGPKDSEKLIHEYAMFITPEELHEYIMAKAHTLKSRGYERFCLEGKFIGHESGYNESDLKKRDSYPLELELAQTGIGYLISHPKYEDKATRLLSRLSAVAKLNHALEQTKKMTLVLEEQIKNTCQTCVENMPAWSERPFLDKLKDIMTLGIRYLFFHKNDARQFKEDIETASPHPNMKKP